MWHLPFPDVFFVSSCKPVAVLVRISETQSSQMVSRSKSPLLSAPQTLHLFLLSLLPIPIPRRLPPTSSISGDSLSASSWSAAAFKRAIFSASSSASGLSSMVSRDEILGERERKEVGVEGMLEEEKLELDGKGSLNGVPLSEGLDVLVRRGVDVGGFR